MYVCVCVCMYIGKVIQERNYLIEIEQKDEHDMNLGLSIHIYNI